MVSKKYLAICTFPSFMRSWTAPAQENVLCGGRIIANILVPRVYLTAPRCPSSLSLSLSGE